MTAMKQLPKYKCHKEVWALRIAGVEIHEDKSATIAPADEGFAPLKTEAGWAERFHGSDEDTGYYVVYQGGYKSWSPTEAFEEGYHRIDGFQHRLLREREELKERLSKLVVFLTDCDHLPPEDLELLGQQAEHMSDYLAVLDKRIVKLLDQQG